MALLIPSFLRKFNNCGILYQTLSSSFMKVLPQREYHAVVTRPDSINRLQFPVSSPLIEHVCGFKVKYKLQKRCKDCFIVVRNERAYVLCKTHPRHKQMSMKKKERYAWILTHATQHKERPW